MDIKEYRLNRQDAGEGWIDLSYGEPAIIRSILDECLGDLKASLLDSNNIITSCVYPNPKGLVELTSLLEEKYGAPVVITNGAKHGLMAIMHAIKKQDIHDCAMHLPYWVSTPGIIESQRIAVKFFNSADSMSAGSCLITTPNNPDGFSLSSDKLMEISVAAKQDNVVLVHDAAYYSPIYIDEPTIKPVADATVYSFSKLWGMSGLRIGYVVVKNEKLLSDVVNFVEQTCSGVSVNSQHIAYKIEKIFKENNELEQRFYRLCREAISRSRKQLDNISPEILEVQPCNSSSMFAWCKAGPKLDYRKVKVNLSDGSGFGKPGFYRVNLAVDENIIKSAVNRLNSLLEVK